MMTESKKTQFLSFLFITILLLAPPQSAFSLTERNLPRTIMTKNEEYIEKYADAAMEQMRRYGIPASVTLAQGIVESANGKSELSRLGNNHFGMKANKTWLSSGGDYLLYDDDKPNEKFCKYESVAASYEHHSRMIAGSKRYARCFQLSPDDYKGWTLGLQNGGYATGKKYAKSLQGVIESNGLQRFDQIVMQQMSQKGERIGSARTEQPKQSPQAEPPKQTADSKEKGFSLKDLVSKSSYAMPIKRSDMLLITSPFGMRDDPINKGQKQFHKGIDINSKYEPVYATEDKGRVTAINLNNNTGGGKTVTIQYDRSDGSQYQCTYMHLDSIDVRKGDTVNAGQELGKSGNSGTRTTGPHLHFGVKEISADGQTKDIDPARYLAEIAVRGNINIEAMNNGKDLLAQYKNDVKPGDINAQENNSTLSPDDWMKKLLSSEDCGTKAGNSTDPIIELAMQMFTGLLTLATQIDQKNTDEQKCENITQSLVSRQLDLKGFVKNLDNPKLTVTDNGNAILNYGIDGKDHEYVLKDYEKEKVNNALNNPLLSENAKKCRVGNIINSFAISQIISDTYEREIKEEQGRQETLRR